MYVSYKLKLEFLKFFEPVICSKKRKQNEDYESNLLMNELCEMSFPLREKKNNRIVTKLTTASCFPLLLCHSSACAPVDAFKNHLRMPTNDDRDKQSYRQRPRTTIVATTGGLILPVPLLAFLTS